ncbi:SsrA-binding protein SmpB [candidate division WWE3 bacterium]|jgi:SsrA-binding protein|nr:SsrA-binding protein SmpB [candidate division WWE3 bacterium]MBT7350270.1 SsrA-binding protein SmpB [candidate division WWE3 bacterium]
MLLLKNRRAYYDFEILEKFLAGIVLKGYEVKAVKEKKVTFEGAYIKVEKDGVYIVNMNISRYSKQSQEIADTETRNARKLLITSKELEKLGKELNQKGKTAIPLALLLKNNLIKLEFAVVKGKKQLGKKQTEKEKQIKKDMETEAKEFKKGLY